MQLWTKTNKSVIHKKHSKHLRSNLKNFETWIGSSSNLNSKNTKGKYSRDAILKILPGRAIKNITKMGRFTNIWEIQRNKHQRLVKKANI